MIRTWHYTLWALAVLAGAIAVLLMARPAAAQSYCAPEARVLERLKTNFGEFEVLRGQAGDQTVVVTHAQDGAWSVIVIQAGIGCILLAGKSSEVDRGI